MATKSQPIDYAGDAAFLGISEERYRKGRRSLAGVLARWKRPDVPKKFHCIDGPYAGADIYLTTSSTGVIRLAEWHGVYKRTHQNNCPVSSGYFYEKTTYNLQWEQCNAR